MKNTFFALICATILCCSCSKNDVRISGKFFGLNATSVYLEQMTAISGSSGIALPGNLFEVLLKMPEVIARKEVYEVTDEEWAVVLEGVKAALADLVAFRKQEGEALALKFQSKISNISQLLASVEPFEKERVEKIRARIEESLAKFAGVDYDRNRLEQEMIFYIEKLDVNEEKQRLANHLQYFIETMIGKSSMGEYGK